MRKNGAVLLVFDLGIVTQRQTPCVTISTTTANKTTILKQTGNKKKS